MEEHVYVLRQYLPVEFEDQETNEFIDYLVSAYLENLATSKYQFSFTAFHMLYMSFIYKVKWLLKEEGNTIIEDSIQEFIRQNRGALFNTLFDFSQFNEKSSLEKLLRTLSFHANDVDLCKNLVEVRNKCSHASGKIYFKRKPQVENYILEEIDNVESIQKKIKPHLKSLFENFINSTWNNNWIQNDLKIWVVNNYLSQKDIEEILHFKPTFLKQESSEREILYKKILYIVLVNELTKYITDKDDYFNKSLSALMIGLPEQIDIRKDLTDQQKLKHTQEIIEEKILPILTELSNEELSKAQLILKLNTIE